MSIEEYIACLASERRGEFLSTLAFYLTMRARGHYVEAGNDLVSAAAGLRCCNELVMVVSKQLCASFGVTNIGYPDEAFLRVLSEKAEIGGCQFDLSWSLERSLLDVTQRSDQ